MEKSNKKIISLEDFKNVLLEQREHDSEEDRQDFIKYLSSHFKEPLSTKQLREIEDKTRKCYSNLLFFIKFGDPEYYEGTKNNLLWQEFQIALEVIDYPFREGFKLTELKKAIKRANRIKDDKKYTFEELEKLRNQFEYAVKEFIDIFREIDIKPMKADLWLQITYPRLHEIIPKLIESNFIKIDNDKYDWLQEQSLLASIIRSNYGGGSNKDIVNYFKIKGRKINWNSFDAETGKDTFPRKWNCLKAIIPDIDIQNIT